MFGEDKEDARQLARTAEMGMLRSSFVPPPEIRALRVYTRHIRDLTADRTRYWQRLEKLHPGPSPAPGRQSRRTSPNTGSTASKPSGDSPTSTTSPPCRPRAASGRTPVATRIAFPEPHRVRLGNLTPDMMRLDTEVKQIAHAIRMAACNAETTLARSLDGHYSRAGDEA